MIAPERPVVLVYLESRWPDRYTAECVTIGGGCGWRSPVVGDAAARAMQDLHVCVSPVVAAPPVLGYSGSGGPASAHAAAGARVTRDGYAPALCVRDRWVSVDHDGDGLPVLARQHGGRVHVDGRTAEGVSCNRCRRELERAGIA